MVILVALGGVNLCKRSSGGPDRIAYGLPARHLLYAEAGHRHRHQICQTPNQCVNPTRRETSTARIEV